MIDLKKQVVGVEFILAECNSNPSPVGVSKKADEMYQKAIEKYNRSLETYTSFECNFGWYILFHEKADDANFKVFKAIQKWVETPTEKEVSDDNKVCLITYLEENWKAWLNSVLEGTYEYMNLTQIVWESWLKV